MVVVLLGLLEVVDEDEKDEEGKFRRKEVDREYSCTAMATPRPLLGFWSKVKGGEKRRNVRGGGEK